MATDPAPAPQTTAQQRARVVLAAGLALVGLWILRLIFLPAIAWRGGAGDRAMADLSGACGACGRAG